MYRYVYMKSYAQADFTKRAPIAWHPPLFVGFIMK